MKTQMMVQISINPKAPKAPKEPKAPKAPKEPKAPKPKKEKAAPKKKALSGSEDEKPKAKKAKNSKKDIEDFDSDMSGGDFEPSDVVPARDRPGRGKQPVKYAMDEDEGSEGGDESDF